MNHSASNFPGSIMAIEYSLPDQIIKNDFFEKNYPAWNVEQTSKKTGVFERRIAAPEETAYDFGLRACKKLLEKNTKLATAIDAIIFCTQSPDYIMPANAFLLQKDLNLKQNAIVFDFNLACSGYLYGLLMASSLMKTGICKNVLLVTADTYSKYIADDDRSTRLLFGDGGAATWISSTPEDWPETPLIREFSDFQCASDGGGWDKFIVKSGGCRLLPVADVDDSKNRKIYMSGLHVLNFVNSKVTQQMTEIIEKNGLKTENINLYFIHQASQLALDSIASKLKIPQSKIFSNLGNRGNLVSSSIPVLMKDFFSQHQLNTGSTLLLSGFGVGFSWSSLIAKK